MFPLLCFTKWHAKFDCLKYRASWQCSNAVVKIPATYSNDAKCCWENGDRSGTTFFFPSSALQWKVSYIFSRKRGVGKYSTSTHKAVWADVQNSCLSPSPAPLAAALGIQFKAGGRKKKKKSKSLSVFLDLIYRVNIIGSVRDVSGKTTAY